MEAGLSMTEKVRFLEVKLTMPIGWPKILV